MPAAESIAQDCHPSLGEAGPYDEHCYAVPPEQLPYSDADMYCRMMYGGRLADVKNSKQMEFVLQLFRDRG